MQILASLSILVCYIPNIFVTLMSLFDKLLDRLPVSMHLANWHALFKSLSIW